MPAEPHYLDTAFLFKLYWDGPGSDVVRDFSASCERLVCAVHGRAEFYSTAHRKCREGASREEINTLLDQFDHDSSEGGIRWLPLTNDIVNRVDGVYRNASPDTFLRAADALHLATASNAGCRKIYSNDRHLLTAARLFGLEGVDLLAGASSA